MSAPMHCHQCDAANTGAAVFCTSCGASLAKPVATRRFSTAAPTRPGQRCRSCGGANPAAALFCVGCGAALGGDAAPAYVATPALAGNAAGAAVVRPVYLYAPAAELPLVIRALWFFFIGLPLGLAWLMVAWLLNLTLIGLPLGLWMLAMMPQVMTLKQSPAPARNGAAQSAASMAVRVVYFVAIGWWLSLLWMLLAWGVAATVIGLPLAFMMFERTGTVLTLSET